MRGGNLKDVFQEESVEFWQLPHNEEKGHSHYPHGRWVGVQPAHIVPATKSINRNCTFNTTHFNGTCMYKDSTLFNTKTVFSKKNIPDTSTCELILKSSEKGGFKSVALPFPPWPLFKNDLGLFFVIFDWITYTYCNCSVVNVQILQYVF